jgi:hypothetical protein
MLTLTLDQRGLLDFLAEQVHELSAAAFDSVGIAALELMAEAEELTALRARLVERAHAVEASAQLQLPFDMRQAA